MRTYARWGVLLTLYLGCAQFVFLAFLQNPGSPDDVERARLTSMVDGTGHRPYVYRCLLPTLVRLVEAATPERAGNAISAAALRFGPLCRLLDATPAMEERAPLTYLIAYALEFASLIGFALVLRALLVHFFVPRPWTADLLPLLGLLGVPVFFRYFSHHYDFPQLFLFALGLLLLSKHRWRWFYLVLLLGALNKETMFLLLVIHILGHARRMPWRLLIAHAAAQLVVLVGVRALLQLVIFADNPGPPVEFWLGRNWEMLSDPDRWGFLFFHFTWVGHQALVVPTNYNVVFLLLVPLVVWRWKDKPILLRRGLWIAPIVFALGLFCGYIDEMRIYYEVYLVVFLLAAHTICKCAIPKGAETK